MKLVPDSLSSALGKVLPFGGSDNKPESSSSPAAPPAESVPEPETDAPAQTVADAAPERSESPDDAHAEETEGPAEAEGSSHDEAEDASTHDESESSAAEATAAHQDADENETSSSSDSDSTSDSDSDSNSNSDSDSDLKDASDITAPSIGPNTVIDHTPPEERLDHDKISDEDAMGNDKRRAVVGQRYSASPARQVVVYALFVVIVVAIVIGGKALATSLDKPDAKVKDAAPWTGNNNPVQRLDFPQYGEPAS